MSLSLIVLLPGAYLLGSICFAIVFARLFGKPDPRQAGSGNPGSTNMLRVAGRGPAILTLLFDIGKAFIPIYILRLLEYDDSALALVGLAIFLGHLFPIWHRFHGGKGVAVYLGFYVAFWPLPGSVIVVLRLLLAVTSNYVSVAGMGAAIGACIIMLALSSNVVVWFTSLAMAVLVVFCHRSNLANLAQGNEKILFKSRR